MAALIGASSKVKLTIGRLLFSLNGETRRCRASLLPTRAFRYDRTGRMRSVLSQDETDGRLPRG